MLTVLYFAEVLISILLVAVVLIQNKSVTLNLASMGGGMGNVTKRGAEKALHNLTIILGAVFIFNSLVLFVVS